MNSKTPSFLLSLAVLAGVTSPVAQVFADSGERVYRARKLSLDDRDQVKDQFRQKRPRNTEKLTEQEQDARSPIAEKAKHADFSTGGVINREEAERSMPYLSRHFKEVDANHDGIVTRDEVRFFREKRMQQRLDRGAGDPRF